MTEIFNGIFDSTDTIISLGDFLLCVGVSLAIGAFLAAIYSYKSRCTSSFLITLAILPAVVCVVIMMVNGNIGAGVAVAGAFSLVRFRSVPGTAKEIGAIFLAMGAGLVSGMGYLAYAALFSIIMGITMVIYNRFSANNALKGNSERMLKITIPEDLNYTEVFDEIFEKYTTDHESISVKTTNMGSLFKLAYNVKLKSPSDEKNFIDELRTRNGNLEVSLCRPESGFGEL